MAEFPAEFVWGVATSAYQIEGGATEGGRGPSIWDTFAERPGATRDGRTGAVACDHYHRWPHDMALLSDLGVDAYRFSVAWTRVQPTGRGPVEQRGLDFYRRVVDALRDRDIEPFVTLYHWDLPQGLEDDGGWRSRDTALRFADYAAVVHEELGDSVRFWTTMNEPFVSAVAGYAEGRHAPGAREGHGSLAAAHHLLLGHGLGVRAMRAQGGGKFGGEKFGGDRFGGDKFGIVLNQSPAVPVGPGGEAAARRFDLLLRRQFTEPLFGGAYPGDYDDVFGPITDLSFRHDGDLDVIGTPLDYVGVNYYYRRHVADAPPAVADPADRTAEDIGVDYTQLPDVPKTGLGWPIEPTGLIEALTDLKNRYPDLPPIYLTENGCAYPEPVEDRERVAFLSSHLSALSTAIEFGVDVRGYFHWSLLDNFEWAHGYGPRFGLVHVDYTTLVRTPKASFSWYRDYIREQRAG
ncbi:GH1 family beta-glucosidase [Actinokineospora guangxiensis]|uniref:Beta-glucosidase n=1 Tax=Actinokineospora guangxiensis TaxID=1490288 RepID=A0ABW0EVZ8_9PSEU